MPSPGVRLPVVPDASATGETAELYAQIRDHFGLGFVPDVFKLTSTRPRFLHVFWEGYLSMFAEGTLPREVKELVAALVARDAGCRYCVDAHLLLLELIGGNPEVAAAARASSVDDIPVEPKVRALLHFVRRIDLEAFRIGDTDVAALRAVGWTDEELLEAIWTACLFNGIVRLVDTLGLYAVGQLADATPTRTS